MIRLALLQARSSTRALGQWIGVVALLPIIWLGGDDAIVAKVLPVGFLQAGILARGAAGGGGAALGATIFPTLPLSPRMRGLATFLAAYLVLVPGFVLAALVLLLRRGPAETAMHAGIGLLHVAPFVAAGAVYEGGKRGTVHLFATALVGGVVGLFGVGQDALAAAIWAVVGTAVVLGTAPRGELPVDWRGLGLLAEVQGEPAWSRRARSPARAFWALQLHQRFMGAFLLGASVLLAIGGLASRHGATGIPLLLVVVTGAVLMTPLVPVLGVAQAVPTLAGLPIAPRTVWRHGLLAGLVPLALVLVLPTAAFVYVVSARPPAPWSSPGHDGARYVATVVLLACATVAFRAGWHLRALVARAPANAAFAATVLAYCTATLFQFEAPLAVLSGREPWDPATVALLVALPTFAILAWADRTVGVRRA